MTSAARCYAYVLLGKAAHDAVLNLLAIAGERHHALVHVDPHADALTIGDTGAAFDVLTNASRAIPGSVRPNHVAVKTANGSVVPGVASNPWTVEKKRCSRTLSCVLALTVGCSSQQLIS